MGSLLTCIFVLANAFLFHQIPKILGTKVIHLILDIRRPASKIGKGVLARCSFWSGRCTAIVDTFLLFHIRQVLLRLLLLNAASKCGRSILSTSVDGSSLLIFLVDFGISFLSEVQLFVLAFELWYIFWSTRKRLTLEEMVLQGLLSRDPLRRVKLEHLLDEVDGTVVKVV